jgi:hypothetical protein
MVMGVPVFVSPAVERTGHLKVTGANGITVTSTNDSAGDVTPYSPPTNTITISGADIEYNPVSEYGPTRYDGVIPVRRSDTNEILAHVETSIWYRVGRLCYAIFNINAEIEIETTSCFLYLDPWYWPYTEGMLPTDPPLGPVAPHFTWPFFNTGVATLEFPDLRPLPTPTTTFLAYEGEAWDPETSTANAVTGIAWSSGQRIYLGQLTNTPAKFSTGVWTFRTTWNRSTAFSHLRPNNHFMMTWIYSTSIDTYT